MPAHLFLKETYAQKDPQVSEQIFFFQNHILLEQTDLLQTSLCHPDSTRLFCSGPTVYFNERKTFSQEFTKSHLLMPGSQVLKSIKKKKVYHIILQAHSNPPPRLFLKTVRISPSICQPGSPRAARLPSSRASRFSPLLHSQAPVLSSPSYSHYEPTPGVMATTEQKLKAKLQVKTRPEQPCLSARPRPFVASSGPMLCSPHTDRCGKPSKSPG